jgi:hypothetical protein
MAELNYPAGIAVENEDHSTPDLGGWHCHIGIPELGLKLDGRDWQITAQARAEEA